MKRKFYISAIYTSPPNTMGGNTKIMIEIVNNLCDKFDFVILTSEPQTFKNYLIHYSKVKVIPIKFQYKRFNYLTHVEEIKYITKIYKEFFNKNKIQSDDYFFTPSDFAPDVLPVYSLRKKYNFNWIASLFLFIPSPYENLSNHYGFPFFKYVIYFIYQNYLFSKILKTADLFLITNDYDRKYFPKNLRDRIFAVYGGVNIEEILAAKKDKQAKKYDAVFCSRLHPQKGISGLLDIWAEVVRKLPNAKLALIGNGEKSYEDFLKEKAKKLNIQKNIKWLGYVNGVGKYKIYLQSKIFLHGTIYDNNGMVAAEALCAGLPVIMYDLPQLKMLYKEGCIKVEVGNKKEYAQKIIDTLNQKKRVNSNSQKKLIEYWNWKNKINSFNSFLNNYDS